VNYIDLVIILVAIGYAIAGFRNGALVGLISFVGFFGGALLGAQLARPIGSNLAGGRAQVPVAIGCVLVLAVLGHVVAALVSSRIRRFVLHGPIRWVDAAAGAVLGVVSVLLVAWMIAVPLASSPYPSVVSAIDRSKVVRAVDDAMPGSVRNVYSSLRAFVDRSGFPPVLGDLHDTHIVTVDPPDPALAQSPAVGTVQPSVLKILSEAPSCGRGMEGSGFVYAPQHVLTNAHVVAGASSVQVQTPAGALTAKVVLFDPTRDVAVLYVPKLAAPSLQFAPGTAKTNDNVIVLGYPQNGGFDARPGRVRSMQTISGRDIYGRGSIDREIYSVRALVRAGNSGGPLIATDGKVLGIVFASALNSPDTGLVLTVDEIRQDTQAGQRATDPVTTMSCTS